MPRPHSTEAVRTASAWLRQQDQLTEREGWRKEPDTREKAYQAARNALQMQPCDNPAQRGAWKAADKLRGQLLKDPFMEFLLLPADNTGTVYAPMRLLGSPWHEFFGLLGEALVRELYPKQWLAERARFQVCLATASRLAASEFQRRAATFEANTQGLPTLRGGTKASAIRGIVLARLADSIQRAVTDDRPGVDKAVAAWAVKWTKRERKRNPSNRALRSIDASSLLTELRRGRAE